MPDGDYRLGRHTVRKCDTSGKVLLTIGKSEVEGEVDRYETLILDQANERDRIIAAMTHMKWGHPARAFSKRAGWVLQMEVD